MIIDTFPYLGFDEVRGVAAERGYRHLRCIDMHIDDRLGDSDVVFKVRHLGVTQR